MATHRRTRGRPRPRPSDRLFWILLRRLWPGWERTLILVKPETVVAWHRQGFRIFWRHWSRGQVGRPRIPRQHRAFIRNHANEVRACDFLTQYTAFLAVA